MRTLEDYESFDFDDGRWRRPVYRRGQGPGVIIIHEIPGLHPLVIRFADRVAAAGMTVYLPSLFGQAGKPVSTGYAVTEMLKAICIRRELAVWASDRSSPIVDWLRALARKVHRECGGRGVGAVGMCLTGGFALAMMTEPSVVAPVVSQPALPLCFGSARRRAGIGASPEEVDCARRRFANENLSMIGLRFYRDPVVPDERFDSYKRELGDAFEAIELDPGDAMQGRGTPHSVLTLHLRDDDPEGPTKRAERRVIEFFRERTGARVSSDG